MLRILSAATLLVLVAAGCGGAAGPQRASRGVPRPLAREWEGQASAIAAAASAGNGCRALQLANSLRADVVASKEKLPRRLRPPLLTGVNALADHITCTPPTVAPEKPPAVAPEKRPKPPHEHGDHGHRGGHGHGPGGKGDGGGGDR